MTSIPEFDKSIIDHLKANVHTFTDQAEQCEGWAREERTKARDFAAKAESCRKRAAQYGQLLNLAEGKPAASAAPVDDRAAVIDGWRQLLDFLEDHPELPVMRYDGITVYAHGDERVAEVDRLAKVLDVQAVRRYRSHIATREFGTIAYEVIATKVYDQDQAEAVLAEGEASHE